MKKVKLTKIGIPEKPKFETAENGEWNRGVNSPPVDTIVTGIPINDLKVGFNFMLANINIENVKEHKEVYCTSKVVVVTPISDTVVEFETVNSKYKLEVI
jgi:hypothetical protein